ncbi:piggyBac transposable element-derived protein 4-like [Xyrauchen texanus]|uniref:piggyBac transposable element-derived protein 4-like n=1 Tax=Xyrauchen texanus TaxID=154827 RepID=UPI002242C5B2|nr:piggyBac transposable element-derived protein 4-like [Xyrauchen texanus]
MSKRTRKAEDSLQEVMEEYTRRESDESGDEDSEVNSDESYIDSELESMVLERGDITPKKQLPDVESDSDWEPDTSSPLNKRPHRVKRQDSTSSREEPHLPSPQKGCSGRSPSGRGWGKGRGAGSSSQAGMSTSTSGERWNDVDVPDITPPQPTFRPNNSPGPQLIRSATYTAMQLFQLFFTNSILQTIIQNTNEFGSIRQSTPTKPWIDITLQDMFTYMSMVIYMGVVKCSALTDYWRGSKLYSLPFPKRVMTGKKFLTICRSLHLSSFVDDAANEQRRGTAAFDRLSKIKPLYREIRDACKRNYHPGQEIAIDERMVASKARIGIKQYMKNKPVRWGYKLFVLADSRNGYTWDFFVYEGRLQRNSGKGLSYESVMELINTRELGTGYKLFVDNFYTSPTLFRDLLQKRIWACGTIRSNVIGFPKTKVNSLESKSPRGSIRWIRNDSLLFVQWRDTRDVFMCSTLHTAHAEDTVKRRVKDADQHWTLKDIPVPPAVKEYNQSMGGVDLSDALIGYYKVLHKTQMWYKTFFYHFMDIAIVNAFLLYKDIVKGKGQVPMHQKAFRETLAEELAEFGSHSTAIPKYPSPLCRSSSAHHRPVYINGNSTNGRLRCRQCQAKTPVKCSSCDVPLCFVPKRDCYNDWHVAKNL